jgi:tRNA pseudouridine38-40 synthase
MRNIKIIVEYDGANYKGWQVQTSEPTIQGVIEEKLGIIFNRKTRVLGSGRTDTGVHALNQVANFFTSSKIETEAIKKGINSLLPPDIVVKELVEVDADFHARYSAQSRVYRYLIWNGDTFSTFYRRFSWQVPQQLDIEGMRKAADHLIGWHDFTSFQGADSKKISAEREIIKFTIRGRTKGWFISSIEANAFLRHMVRNIMGTLLEVGKGSMTVEEFRDILASRDRRRAGVPAPPQGLFLKEVKY